MRHGYSFHSPNLLQWARRFFRHSLQGRLLFTLTAVCLLFSGLVATVSFYQSYRQAQTLQDAKLESLVSLAKNHDLSIDNDQIDIDFKESDFKKNQSPTAPLARPTLDSLEQDIANNQTLIYWLDDARLQDYFSQDTLYHLTKKDDGFYEIQGKNGTWRLYIYTQIQEKIVHLPSPREKPKNPYALKTPPPTLTKTITKERRLVIGELLDIRNQLAWQSAKTILLPLLLLIPLLLLVIAITVHQVFKPLARLTDGLTQNFNAVIHPNRTLEKSALKTEWIDPFNEEKLPNEIRPFIQVIREQMQHLLDSLALNERFVSNASHQLRTPMTAIFLQAQQLKLNDNATPAHIREQSHAIDSLLDSIKRNNHLINQLLTLSKSEQKNQPSAVAPFSPSQVVTDVLLDFYPIASQKNINLGVAVLQDVKITIAELSFKIIVQNLIENAIKYTPPEGQVDISLFDTDGATYLMVQDSGIGISEAELDNILEPFYRANAVTAVTQTPQGSPLAEGFGLGLAIVNNLVTASQGELIIANHQNLLKNQPNFRPDLAEKVTFYQENSTDNLQDNTDTPLDNPLFESPALQGNSNDFITGLCVQIRWVTPTLE